MSNAFGDPFAKLDWVNLDGGQECRGKKSQKLP